MTDIQETAEMTPRGETTEGDNVLRRDPRHVTPARYPGRGGRHAPRYTPTGARGGTPRVDPRAPEETPDPTRLREAYPTMPIPERDPRRSTLFTEGGTEIRPSRPKLEKPRTYNGEYTVEYSVLNWIKIVGKYLQAYRLTNDDWSMFAYTYMGTTVQAWYDITYSGGDPPWETLIQDLSDRFLPPDHELLVTKRYEEICQTSTIMKYVERYQEILVAMQSANIVRSEKELVLQFIRGLSQEEDRRTILNIDPPDIVATYIAANKLRQAKTLARRSTTTPRTKKRTPNTEVAAMQLLNLTGQKKADAFKKGLCIGCGEAGHWIADCKKVTRKMSALRVKSGAARTPRTPSSTTATKGSKTLKKTRFNNIEAGDSEKEYEDEDESAPSENGDGTDLSDSDADLGNADPESEEDDL